MIVLLGKLRSAGVCPKTDGIRCIVRFKSKTSISHPALYELFEGEKLIDVRSLTDILALAFERGCSDVGEIDQFDKIKQDSRSSWEP